MVAGRAGQPALLQQPAGTRRQGARDPLGADRAGGIRRVRRRHPGFERTPWCPGASCPWWRRCCWLLAVRRRAARRRPRRAARL